MKEVIFVNYIEDDIYDYFWFIFNSGCVVFGYGYVVFCKLDLCFEVLMDYVVVCFEIVVDLVF